MQYPKMWVCDDPKLVEEMLDYWKPFLGLSDWAISLSVKPMIDVPHEGIAASSWLLSRRTAWLDLSHSETRCKNTIEDDAEQSLLHELLHVTFSAWHDHSKDSLMNRSTLYNVCCEQPIDQLAETLALMRRSSGHKFSFEQEGSNNEDIQSR